MRSIFDGLGLPLGGGVIQQPSPIAQAAAEQLRRAREHAARDAGKRELVQALLERLAKRVAAENSCPSASVLRFQSNMLIRWLQGACGPSIDVARMLEDYNGPYAGETRVSFDELAERLVSETAKDAHIAARDARRAAPPPPPAPRRCWWCRK